ncbi:nucleotidyltransferase family protein [Chitinimonas sp.]|uniref:nucleotidyltransferase family protein n=1 Tax=Chitinimonas sp. TaxID=1934313 RepID=UPI002F920FF4
MIAAILLAAGSATRFGSDKRQALTHEGESLLATVLQCYAMVFPKLAVVVGPDDDFGLAQCARFGVHALVNPSARQGLGSSVACGIRWAQAQDLVGVVMGLADMPFVRPDTLAAVADRLTTAARLVMPVYQGRPGHPRGIPCTAFAALATLGGERGAAAVLDWSQALQLSCDDAGCVLDIDTPAMLAEAQASRSA